MRLKNTILVSVWISLGSLLLAACALTGAFSADNRPPEQVELAGLYDEDIAEIPAEAYTLFAENCSACHGPTGAGTDIAPPLNSAELRERLDETEIFDTITNGRPGTAMPVWGLRLSADEISALVALVRNWDKLDPALLDTLARQADDCSAGRGMHRHMGPMMGSGCGNMRGPMWFFDR